MYHKEGPNYIKTHILTKARLLKRKFPEFACVDASHIEHLLKYMRNSDKNEFTYCLDQSRMYNDCVIAPDLDDSYKLEALQYNFEALKKRCDELQSDFDVMCHEYKQLHAEYQFVMKLDQNIDMVMKCLIIDAMNEVQYYNVLRAVLNKIKVNKSGEIKFHTGTHVFKGIIVSLLNQNKESLLDQNGMQYHIKNLNKFIEIKCGGNDKLIRHFILSVIATNKWKNIIKTNLGICDKLNKTQTIKQFIRSGGSTMLRETNYLAIEPQRVSTLSGKQSGMSNYILRCMVNVHWKCLTLK